MPETISASLLDQVAPVTAEGLFAEKVTRATYELVAPPPAKAMKAKSYSDNFRFGRSENWTH